MAPLEMLDVTRELANTAHGRVAQSLGPQQGDEAAYWQELAEFQDWSRWVPPADYRVDTTPDWRQV